MTKKEKYVIVESAFTGTVTKTGDVNWTKDPGCTLDKQQLRTIDRLIHVRVMGGVVQFGYDGEFYNWPTDKPVPHYSTNKREAAKIIRQLTEKSKFSQEDELKWQAVVNAETPLDICLATFKLKHISMPAKKEELIEKVLDN